MATATGRYLGDLHVECKHCDSGAVIATDAPKDNQGKGEAFSPTDLCATALGACIMTIIGIYAKNNNVDVSGAAFEVTKTMSREGPRRIAKIEVVFRMPAGRAYSAEQKRMIEQCAETAPMHLSLHPDIEQVITFIWEDGK